jgi:hypothetical protein
MVLIHLFRLISLINVADGNLWTDKKKIDRALLILNGTKFSNDLIIWQNTKECHHCSWIRSRDKLGNVILNLTENVTKYVWVDTRWPQRFRFTPFDMKGF